MKTRCESHTEALEAIRRHAERVQKRMSKARAKAPDCISPHSHTLITCLSSSSAHTPPPFFEAASCSTCVLRSTRWQETSPQRHCLQHVASDRNNLRLGGFRVWGLGFRPVACFSGCNGCNCCKTQPDAQLKNSICCCSDDDITAASLGRRGPWKHQELAKLRPSVAQAL